MGPATLRGSGYGGREPINLLRICPYHWLWPSWFLLWWLSETVERMKRNPNLKLRVLSLDHVNPTPQWITGSSLSAKDTCDWVRKDGGWVGGRLALSCSAGSAVEPHFLFWELKHWNFLLLSCWPATGPKLVQFNYNKHTANGIYLTLASTSGLSSDGIVLAYATPSPLTMAESNYPRIYHNEFTDTHYFL